MPLSTFASTFGFDGAFVVQKLLDQDNPDLGYDPIKGLFVNKRKNINENFVLVLN